MWAASWSPWNLSLQWAVKPWKTTVGVFKGASVEATEEIRRAADKDLYIFNNNYLKKIISFMKTTFYQKRANLRNSLLFRFLPVFRLVISNFPCLVFKLNQTSVAQFSG
jgi:hypothetical protein